MFKRVIITSGPTIEPIDPVRFISNRSSGKSGFHLAEEAKKREIPEIIFITGPTCYLPTGINLLPIETTLEMQNQLKKFSPAADVIIMSAAVADYRPVEYSSIKIKKNRKQIGLTLVKNPDLLYDLGETKKNNQILVGYAAESHDIFQHAQNKFQKKNLDLLVLNEISQENPAFGAEENQVYFYTAKRMRKLEKMEKSSLAVHIWDEIYNIAQSFRIRIPKS